MAKVKAFKGMRYADVQNLKDLVTPPYDIISPKEQDDYYNLNDYNVIRLEYGKELPNDNETNNKYTRAGEYLNKWLGSGVLTVDEKPCFYVYEEIFDLPDGSKKSIRGLVCKVKLQEFSDNVVLPHEETLSKAKTDRFNLMSATGANFSQIYSLYIDRDRVIPKLIDGAIGEKAASFVDEDNITQNLWIIENEDVISKIENEFEDKQLFIADGHHRYETALNYMKSQDGSNENANYVMMFLIDLDNEGLVVFPTHRMVKNVVDFNITKLLTELQDDFTIEKIDKSQINTAIISEKMSAFVFYAGENDCYKLVFKNPQAMDKVFDGKSKAYRDLDVNVLHTLILEKLGIDAKNMALQTNLTYTRDKNEAIDSVDNGDFQCSFILNATKVEQIKDVSLAGEKMPQKSTYFYPKLKTGLVMNKF